MLHHQTAPLTAPSPADQIAAAFNANTNAAITDIIAASLSESIRAHPNPRHAAMFAARHGIDNTGHISNQQATFDEIAGVFGCRRETVTNQYHRAATIIFARLSDDLVRALRSVMT